MAVSVVDRNEGLVLTIFNWLGEVFALVTLWVETVLGLILDRNEDFSNCYLGGSGPSRWCHLFWVEFALWVYALDRTEVLFS